MAKRSYVIYDSWKKFQSFFPEGNRLDEDNLPKEEYTCFRNMTIHMDRYEPEGSQSCKIMLVHGGGANGRLMSPIALTFKRYGYEVISPDLPGFGLTTYNHVIEYKDWIDTVAHLVKKEYEKDGKPIILFGISLGGMLAYQVACIAENIKGLIVTTLADTTTFDVQKTLAKSEYLAKGGAFMMNTFSFILDKLKIPIKTTTHMSRMANNPDFVKLLCNDKVGSGSWVCFKWLRTLQNTTAEISPEEFDKCPLLFLHPKEDKLLSFEVSKPFYDRLIGRKEMKYLTNCGHIPLEQPGIDEMEEYIITFINTL